jgi:hypothetical protein
VDRLEQPSSQQPRQLARITTVGLDPVTRPLRHQPRSDQATIDPAVDEIAIKTEPGRASLVTTPHPRPAAKRSLNRPLVVRQRPLIKQLVSAQRRKPNRTGVNI